MQFLCFVIFGCFCAIVVAQAPDCITPNGENAKCVPLRLCPILKDALTSTDPQVAAFVEASGCSGGKLSVCCGTLGNFKPKEVTTAASTDVETQQKLRRDYVIKNILPTKKFCGMQHWDDYFHTEAEELGTEASVNEFPWMMIVDSTRRCTGFLIHKRYFISTVLCYFYRVEESQIIIGVHHIRKNISCISTQFGEDDCTEGKIVVQPAKVFDLGRRIVLAKLTKDLDYSDFVRPICLPFSDDEIPKINDTVLTSGWGESSSSSENFVKIKKRSVQRRVDNEKCYIKFMPRWEEDICTLPPENSSITTCWGDEGGPLMYRYRKNWFAAGIVNSASDCTLGDPTSATGITPKMVNKILDYIYQDYCGGPNSRCKLS